MNQNRKKGILVGAIIFFVGMLISSPFIISYLYLPTEIRLIAGEEHLFNFDIPLKANILTKEDLIIKKADNTKIEETSISLSQPFYVTMPDEGKTNVSLSLLGIIPLKTVSVQALSYQELIPCGKVVGICVNTEGIMVLGVGDFEVNGKSISPCKGLIEPGDLILKCNDTTLVEKEDLRNCVEKSGEDPVMLTIKRNGEEKIVFVNPVYAPSDGAYKIGLWVRDSTQGIGTITYVTPGTGSFGALGHGITDSQTKKLMPVSEGTIVKANIMHIKKGDKGEPGEISGVIEYSAENEWGIVESNTPLGIYGVLDEEQIKLLDYPAIPIAFQDEVHEGKASIMVDLLQGEPKEYEVMIQKVSKYSGEPTKGMVIKITDEELLEETNGIIQGMSGSPILQDGKLIGAVTHVFIQDPTRGYGIFIENMINNEKR